MKSFRIFDQFNANTLKLMSTFQLLNPRKDKLLGTLLLVDTKKSFVNLN